ncbi:PAS domain-containing protein [Thermosipho atlanticus]|uniref:PAS domain S-box-containing protein n=1 Tax=Thermosipho atlanticus DSM 15807 TaxID=1123380 RepID=A0A1M5T4A3_9BACT|nr:PAS domain-containing protein [Thermosipho atlanticus]SHH45522.1 PAS domain S-box-containing protein [Thermosipho atlanticus DSM 15807]
MRHLFYLQQFFERFPAPAFIKDNKLRYLWINKEWEKFFGINERRVIGKTNKKLFGEDVHEEIDKKIIKSKRAVTYETELFGKYLIVNKIPIRLGDGTYGVAGFIIDNTDRYLYELSLKGVLTVNEIIRELLMEHFEDKDSFMIVLFERLRDESEMGDYALIKDDVILKSYIPEKVCERAKAKEDLKEFSVDNEKWIVLPIENYKLVIKSLPYYFKLIKQIYPITVPKIENVLKSIEETIKTERYYKTLEKMVKTVTSWKKKDLKTFFKKVLEDIVEIIPEAEKGSVWLIVGDEYKCLAEKGYPGASSLSFPKQKTAYGTDICNKINRGEKVFEITNAKELVEKSVLAQILSSYGMNDPNFIPLIGVFKIGNKVVGNISVDNFSKKHFSEESKKILGYFVDLLTAFLSEHYVNDNL